MPSCSPGIRRGTGTRDQHGDTEKDLDAEWYHLLECPVTWDVNIYYREDAYLGTMEQDLIQMAEDVFGKRKLWKGV